MSTVPETITARHLGMKVLALSVVSNVSYPPERIEVTTVEEVIKMVESKGDDVEKIITKAISFLP